jgi:hypothetical protein
MSYVDHNQHPTTDRTREVISGSRPFANHADAKNSPLTGTSTSVKPAMSDRQFERKARRVLAFEA